MRQQMLGIKKHIFQDHDAFLFLFTFTLRKQTNKQNKKQTKNTLAQM